MMFPLTPANLPILHRYWVDGKGMDDYIFPILDKTRYQTDTHVMGKNLYHQPYKAIRFHKGFGVGHNDGIDHPSIYRLLIPSREQALLIDLLCNLVYLHPVVRGC